MDEKSPDGWMVCISMKTLASAEATARDIERRLGFFAHTRPIIVDDRGLETVGPRVWEKTNG